MIPITNEKNFKDIKTVHLQLGPECNMHCRHCQQMPSKSHVLSIRKPTEEVKKVIGNFILYTQKKGSELHKDSKGDPHYRLFFWGGEALLHWELIKELVVEYTEKYNILSNEAFRFVVTSNGLLLTDEMVEFFNKYEVIFYFSYDAPYPFAVRGFVPDEICERVNRIRFHKILASGNAINCDPMLAYNCLMKKFPYAQNYDVGIMVMRTFDMAKDIDNYDWEKVRVAIRKVVIAAKQGNEFALDFVKQLAFPYVHSDINFFRVTGGLPYCILGKYLFALDLEGNIPICHDSCIKIGSINDSLEEIYNKSTAFVKNRMKNIQCSNCEHKDFCVGPCPLTKTDKDGDFLMCKNFKRPFQAIVKEEIMAFGNPLSSKEKEWFQEQEEIMERQVQAFLLEGQRYEKERTRLPKNMV